MFRSDRLIGILVATLLGLCMVAPSSAQFWRGGGGNSINNPPVNQREFDMMARMLKLDEVQQEIAADMFAVLQNEFGQISEVAREISQGVREEFSRTRDPSVWQEFQRRMATFEARVKELGEQFYGDVRILLVEDQMELWDSFERRRFRGRAITRQEQMLSGVGIDLVVLTEEMRLSNEQREAVSEVLNQYEIDLDRRLRTYRRIADEQQRKAEELGQNGNWMQNLDQYNEIFASVRNELVQVRGVHERYLSMIASRLEPEAQADLRRRYNTAAYPDIYRDSYVDTGLRQIMAMDSLTEEQREFVVAVNEGWQRESERLRGQLARSQREREESMRLQDMWGGTRNTDTREAQNKLRDLQIQFYDQLLSVLTEEQKVGLPERPATDWRNRSFDF
ncbi:MAG: hypothetical protein ACNA8P_04360 [Phycisphaerales bacterium]